MIWENDFASETETEVNANRHSKLTHGENEQKRLIQLQKLQDPAKDERRKVYIAAATKFGELLINNRKEEIVQSLLAEDCEAFLFNFGEIIPVNYTTEPSEFLSLYKDARVIKRNIKEVFVDSERSTAFQICYCEILKEEDGSTIHQFSFEAFSFKNDKISKYRASYGSSHSFDEFNHPFESSTKDKMLAKVKELNYAWANQPDFERIASLLHESTEYKIWSWEDQKGVVLYKHDFAPGFKNLEQSYMLTCVVPYEVYSEGQFIIGTYVYHLEGRNDLSGKKFIWLSTCIYTFDKGLNIAKINQQGELHLENEMQIPFEVFSRDKLIEDSKVSFSTRFQQTRQNESIFTTDDYIFSFEACSFGSKNLSKRDIIRGFNDFVKSGSLMREKNSYQYEWANIVDVFVDHHAPSYDVVITIKCLKGIINKDDYKYSGMDMIFYSINKMCYEKGKIAKVAIFSSEIPEVIPSPYDDPDFRAQNIRHKGNDVL